MQISKLLLLIIFIGNLSMAQNDPPIIKLGQPELDKVKLFVFVGEKISVERVQTEGYSFDNLFTVKYKILKEVYGHIQKDTLEFRVGDHYGVPPFTKYKNVLLYVSQNKDGKWYHQKYQYSDVYETVDGRWATPGKDPEYRHSYNENPPFQPEKINFKEDFCFDVKDIESEYIKSDIEPYYEIEKGKACARMGNYVEELFELKKSGVLHARGLF